MEYITSYLSKSFSLLGSILRFLWSILWIRKDHDHWTLDYDYSLMSLLNKKLRERYCNLIMRRRNIAFHKHFFTPYAFRMWRDSRHSVECRREFKRLLFKKRLYA